MCDMGLPCDDPHCAWAPRPKVEILHPICNMGGGQLAALRAAMSRMEELTQTGIPVVLVERVGRAWVVSTGTPQSREVFLWANYTSTE